MMPDFDAEAFDSLVAADSQIAATSERQAIERRKAWLRINAQAAAELAAETAPVLPASVSGVQLLAEPDTEPPWRITDLWPAGGNVICAAQYKAGKTTLGINLIRSLVDGEAFLGEYPVSVPAGRLYVIDTEMPRRTMRRWLAEAQIANADRLEYVNLRGQCATLDLRSARVRTQWAAKVRDAGATVLVLDPLGAVLTALGLTENDTTEVGAFLDGFQAMLAGAGAAESYVAHHMGHLAERSRGASRLRDWPDAEWRLVRQQDEPGSPRYLSAYGRDVDVPESRLDYERASRRLWVRGGSRRDAEKEAARTALVKLLTEQPGLSTNRIEIDLTGDHGRQAVRDALSAAIRDGQVLRADGKGNAQVHTLNPKFAGSPEPAESGATNLVQFAGRLKGGELGELGS